MVDGRTAIEKQAASRLRVIKSRIAKLQGEQALIERILEDNARRFAKRPLNLRKNSLTKLAIESEIAAYLRSVGVPAKAQAIYAMLIRKDPNLKGATFRSHLKRLADAGVIEREGPRGCYQLVRKQSDDDGFDERETFRPRRRQVQYGYIDAANISRPKFDVRGDR